MIYVAQIKKEVNGTMQLLVKTSTKEDHCSIQASHSKINKFKQKETKKITLQMCK